jgi:putative oxidoreductase
MLRQTAIWTVAILMGLFFVLVGLTKLAGPSAAQWALRLSRWGYPSAARYAIGGIEISAGLGLLVPSVRRFAAVALIVVMVGAFVTHLVHGEFVHLLPPLILTGLSWGLYRWQPYASHKT